jgi:hypothetical protein
MMSHASLEAWHWHFMASHVNPVCLYINIHGELLKPPCNTMISHCSLVCIFCCSFSCSKQCLLELWITYNVWATLKFYNFRKKPVVIKAVSAPVKKDSSVNVSLSLRRLKVFYARLKIQKHCIQTAYNIPSWSVSIIICLHSLYNHS